MKRLILIIIATIGILSATKAGEWTPDNLPMVHLQDSTRYVCNPDGVLTDSTCRKMDTILRSLKNKKGIESVVVAVKQIKGGDPYEFAMGLGNKYGVGDKQQSTGLIVVLSTGDRAYQILTGRGLEGTLPDVMCYNIQQQYMVPYLKQGKWDEAMLNGIKAIGAEILQDPTLKPGPTNKGDKGSAWLQILIIAGIVAGFIGLATFMSHKKCPKCHKRKLTLVSRKKLKAERDCTYFIATYKCQNCGFQFIREDKENHNSGPGAGMLAGGIIAGSLLRGRGGGGFGGGSFGGGSFGGGGAGGRF